jgi:CheY-like chemotaxis protein
MTSPRGAAPAGKLVLVVDDDPDFLMQLALQLSAAGFEAETAASLAEAEATLARRWPDLVITDLGMESPDAGFALCQRVKARSPATPVVIVTAMAYETALGSQARLHGERGWTGADALLAKPVRADALRRELARLLPP